MGDDDKPQEQKPEDPPPPSKPDPAGDTEPVFVSKADDPAATAGPQFVTASEDSKGRVVKFIAGHILESDGESGGDKQEE